MNHTQEQNSQKSFGNDWSSPHTPLQNMKKILLVDGNETFLQSHTEILRNAGFSVDAVNSGKNAIFQANFNHMYDLILIDIELSDMNCFSVAAEIRLHRGYTGQKIAVLSDTQYISDGMMRDFLLVDVSAIITKPFSEMEVFKILNISAD